MRDMIDRIKSFDMAKIPLLTQHCLAEEPRSKTLGW